MALFQITIDDKAFADTVSKRLQDQCGENFYALRNGLSWICEMNNGVITADVSKSILNSSGEESKGQRVVGIVVRIDNYMGYYDASLWEKARAWSEERG